MATTKTIIKNRLQSGEDPALALTIINHQLCDNNITDMFVTVWLCVLELSSGRLVYVNGGHNPPLQKQGSSGFSFLVSPPDLPLAGMDDIRYHCREMYLKPGDTLFLYTDGIVEASATASAAIATDEEIFYGKERLKAFLDAHADKPLKEIFSLLRSDIDAFCTGAEQSDDITMMALRICGEEKPARHSLTLKADIACLDELNAFIVRELGELCPQKERGQIELAAEEVFVNIARYAYGEEGGEVTVNCRVEKEQGRALMTLAFADTGRPFNPLEYPVPDPNVPMEERQEGGLGLLIVKRTMDTIRYSREKEKNCLEFCKSWQKERK
jgi:sigma-B regulation protein RsbU (phosphoserine phosphatase)